MRRTRTRQSARLENRSSDSASGSGTADADAVGEADTDAISTLASALVSDGDDGDDGDIFADIESAMRSDHEPSARLRERAHPPRPRGDPTSSCKQVIGEWARGCSHVTARHVD